MSFIVGTPLPKDLVLIYSLTHIYGIGLYQSKIICKKAGFGLDSRGKDINYIQAKNLEKIKGPVMFIIPAITNPFFINSLFNFIAF